MKKEFGKWLMDIAKYVATAVLLSSFFADIDRWEWYFYVLTVILVAFLLSVGLWFTKEERKK